MSAFEILDATDEAASEARLCMRSFLDGPGPRQELATWLALPYHVSDAEIVVSELVTNAAEHGRPPIGLRLTVAHDAMRIEVADASCVLPELPPEDPTRETGRGLRLVATLSDAWGTTATGDGKVVWAILGVGVGP